MNAPFAACSSVKPHVSEAEWAARVELAAFYRAIHRNGWSQLTNNHVTLRVPDAEDQFLLNPHGLAYDEVTASSLMKIDLAGNILLQPDHGLGINYTGFVIHGAIHGARPELHCVAHTHTVAGVAVSTLACGLMMSNNSACFLVDNIAYHAWEGPSLSTDEQERLVASLGTKDAMILRHHGLLAAGRNVAETFLNLHSLETACQVQLAAMASGQALLPPPEEAVNAMRAAMGEYRRSGAIGRLEWGSEKRRLDREEPDYRN